MLPISPRPSLCYRLLFSSFSMIRMPHFLTDYLLIFQQEVVFCIWKRLQYFVTQPLVAYEVFVHTLKPFEIQSSAAAPPSFWGIKMRKNTLGFQNYKLSKTQWGFIASVSYFFTIRTLTFRKNPIKISSKFMWLSFIYSRQTRDARSTSFHCTHANY